VWESITKIWVAAILLCAIVSVSVSSIVNQGNEQALKSAERDLSSLTALTAEHANRVLRNGDQVIKFVIDRYLDVGNKLNLVELTNSGVIDSEIFNQVGIINAQGIYAFSNKANAEKMDLSDREHFKVHLQSNDAGLFISKPVIGRASGLWSVQLTRRINLKNGEFGGVVVVSLDPRYFTNFYSKLNTGRKSTIGLYGIDGATRARVMGGKADFLADASRAEFVKRISLGELVGTYRAVSIVDKEDRIYFYRQISNSKLVATAGLSVDEVMEAVLQSAVVMYWQAGALILLILMFATAISRYLIKIRRHEAKLQASNEQLASISMLSPDGVVTFDKSKRVIFVNHAFIQMMELKADFEVAGMHEAEFSEWMRACCSKDKSFIGVAQMRARKISNSNDGRELIKIECNSGKILHVELRITDTFKSSQILYLRNVTHEVEVDEIKTEFLTTAAHELRTPMASIMGFSELLLDDQDESTREEFLGIIHTQCSAMAAILDEFLDLARIEERRDQDFDYEYIDLSGFCREIVKSLAVPSGRNVPEIDVPEQLIQVLVDVGKLRRSILNVLTNAYKYSPKGGRVKVKLELKSNSDLNEEICIAVIDEGLGMRPDVLARVFERFYRADTSGKIPGTGLGMSLVKEVIQLHGGRVDIESVFGQGTIVRIYLPLLKR